LKRLKILVRQILLYGVIGWCSALLDLLLFTLLYYGFSVNEFLTNVISVHAGIALSFILNRKFNFKKTDRVLFRVVSFYLIGLLGLLLSNGLLWLGRAMTLLVMPVKITSVFIVAIVQFTLNKLIAFGK